MSENKEYKLVVSYNEYVEDSLLISLNGGNIEQDDKQNMVTNI